MTLRFKIMFALICVAAFATVVTVVPMVVGAQQLTAEGAAKERSLVEHKLREAINGKVEQARTQSIMVATMPVVQEAVKNGDCEALNSAYSSKSARMVACA